MNSHAAYEALRASGKPDALAELARAAVLDGETGEDLRANAKKLELTQDDVKTPFGDALEVLARGPEDDAEQMLACALGALAVASAKTCDAALVTKLAAKSAFDPSTLLDEALGERADTLFGELAKRAMKPAGNERESALVAAAILVASKRPRARKELDALAKSEDALVRAMVTTQARAPETHLAGELVPAPRNPALTILLGITGLLFVASLVRLLMRLVLVYRVPAEVSASATGVRIRARTEMLGRTLRDREIVIGSEALARAVREVRFPRLGLYAGLIALAIGTYVGVGALTDGARVASPSLLAWGFLFVVAGVVLDLILSSVRYGAKGKCRIVLAPRKGSVVCIGGVDPKRADAALASLAQR